MILFYGKNSQQIVVTPYRNGSQFLKENSHNFRLLYLEMSEITQNEDIFEMAKFFLRKAQKKIFVYRDPFERLYSVYNTFMTEKGISTDDIKKEIAENLLLKDVTRYSKNHIKDFESIVNHLEKVYANDLHVMPQSNYFKIMNEEIEDYEIIDYNSYHKMLKLYFDPEVKEISSWDTNRTPAINENLKVLDLQSLLEIRSRIFKIYKDDYAILKPKAQTL